MTDLFEKYAWAPPEFYIKPTDKETVKIRGKAIPHETISRNKRKYVDDEMRKAARTFIDVPVTENHKNWMDKKNHIGKVNWMEYEDGSMEYVAEVWNPSMVSELRAYAQNPKASKVHGVSIEADFLHIQCARCSKQFTSESEWAQHMKEVERIPDLPLEPHGIRGRALSIVTGVESPGVIGNTLEVLETAPKFKDFSQLLETVIKYKVDEENYKMSKVSVSQEASHIAIGKGKEVLSNAPASVNLPVTSGKSEEKKDDQIVQKNQVIEPSTPLTQTIETPITPITETKTPKTITLKEQAKIGKLTFKEEECTPFEQCVKDGGSPEECARKYKEVKERNESMKLIAQTVNEIIDVVSQPITLSLPPEPAPYNDKPLREMIQAIPKDDLGWKDVKPYNDAELREMITSIKPFDDRQLREAIAAIKPYDDSKIQEFIKSYQPYNDKEIKEALANIKPYDDKAINEQITKITETLKEIQTLKEAIAAIPKDDVTWKDIKPYDPAPILAKIDEMAKTIPTAYNDKPIQEQLTKLQDSIKENQTLKETITKLTDEFKTVKEAYEANLAAYKKDLKEYWEPLKTKQETQQKELESIKETAEKAKVIAENADDKTKPVFKGHNKTTVTEKQTPNFTYNPTGAP